MAFNMLEYHLKHFWNWKFTSKTNDLKISYRVVIRVNISYTMQYDSNSGDMSILLV